MQRLLRNALNAEPDDFMLLAHDQPDWLRVSSHLFEVVD